MKITKKKWNYRFLNILMMMMYWECLELWDSKFDLSKPIIKNLNRLICFDWAIYKLEISN